MGHKYFFKNQSSLQRKVLVSGLVAVFCLSKGTFSSYTEAAGSYTEAVEKDMGDRCAACLIDVLTGCEENLKNLIGSHKVFVATFSICFMLAFLCCVFPYIIWNIFYETQESKNSKKKNSQGTEDYKESPEDETQILKNKQYAPLIVRLALRATMMIAGAATAVALTKKFSGGYKNSNSLKSEKFEKLKKSESDPDNSDKAESVLPLSHEVNDERKKEQIGQKSGDENK